MIKVVGDNYLIAVLHEILLMILKIQALIGKDQRQIFSHFADLVLDLVFVHPCLHNIRSYAAHDDCDYSKDCKYNGKPEDQTS